MSREALPAKARSVSRVAAFFVGVAVTCVIVGVVTSAPLAVALGSYMFFNEFRRWKDSGNE